MEGWYSSLSLVGACTLVLTRLQERIASCAVALQYCRQAAAATLQVLCARAHQLDPATLRKRATKRSVGVSEAPGITSDEAVVRKRKLRIAFNKRILLETAEKQPQIKHGFLEVLVKDMKTMVQFTPV